MREQLEIVIDGDARGAKNATKQAGAAIGGLGSTLKKMAIAGGALFLAKKAFDALSSAIKGMIGFVKESIQLAGEQQLQEKKLQQALTSTKQYTDKLQSSLVDYAKSLQEVTRYGDETIIGVEAMLATFKLNEEQIKVATLATLDLAAATGQDLQSAAILLGKAMVGETGMLKRYGIIVDENKLAAEGWKAVIDEINVEFGGQAQAQADTYLGKIDQLKNTFGDMREQLGNAFIPTISKVVEWFTKGSEVIDEHTGKVIKMASPWERLQGWLKQATANMENWLELNWDNIVGLAESAFSKIEEFIRIAMEADYTSVQEGIEHIASAFNLLIGTEDSGVEGATNKYQDFVDLLGESLHALGTFIGLLKTIYHSLELIATIIVVVVAYIESTARAIKSLVALGNKDIPEFVRNVEEIGYAWKSVGAYAREAYNNMIAAWRAFLKWKSGGGGGTTRQAGGIMRTTQPITDLGIVGVKDEGILPAPVVRAIRENRGSFAGLDMSQNSNSVNNNFYISELVVREEADVDRIAESLYEKQELASKGIGIK